jgi:hypothetical protein
MKSPLLAAATLAIATLAACSSDVTSPASHVEGPSLAVSQTGNGAPSGAHYTLNIIGMAKGKTADMSNSQGHRIFVGLGRSGDAVVTNIKLTEGAFAVIDANGTDDGTATFQLPNPVDDANGDGVDDDGRLGYSVYVRALGAPTGRASLTSCYTDLAGTWCNAGELVVPINRVSAGKFIDVSKQLLQVCVDVDETDVVDLELEPIFSDENTDYFWEYTNEGLRLAQLRFYPLPSAEIGGDCTRDARI